MRHRSLRTVAIACLFAVSAGAQTSSRASEATAVVPRAEELKPRIIVEPPLEAPLSFGAAVIPYRTEHLQVAPVFGPAALAISPKLGHIHVSVDDAAWVWANTSGQPVVVQGLSPGRHKVTMRLMTPTHQPLDEGFAEFTVPEPVAAQAVRQEVQAHSGRAQTDPAAKIIIGSPLAEPLARGVIIIPYRVEHLQLAPVFGPEALAVSPRLGHLHVTVDDTPWHWADGSGNSIIVAGLSPGPHRIRVELSNTNHQVIDRGTVQVAVPGPGKQ